MSGQNNWYNINDIAHLDTPALVVYPARVKENIQILKGMIADPLRLRPHVKTHKCPQAAILTLQQGIGKFKCATIAEAEMLGMCNAPDVLLAYQPLGPKLKRLISLIRRFQQTRFSCLVDNHSAAGALQKASDENNLVFDIYIDLNVGMNRTGIAPGQGALDLYIYCMTLPGINLIGLHAYDGHIHQTDLAERRQTADAAFLQVEKLKQNIIDKGYPSPVVIAGGSPTFPIHAARGGVECSPGTFIYWDRGYSLSFAEQPFLTAALVISRVISQPDETKLCLDVGHKSISSENELNKRIYFLNAPELAFIGHSEEHLVVDAGIGHHYKVGDVFYGLPYHVCPTIALYERAVTIENNSISGEWRNIARDRMITI